MPINLAEHHVSRKDHHLGCRAPLVVNRQAVTGFIQTKRADEPLLVEVPAVRHAGVPYGRNFDQQRLVGSFCLNETGDGLAINHKGRTAAEMMVFSRYVMFSEVYWHHAVRAGTAMLQRAFYLLHKELDLDQLLRQ